jgi:hypothetical protein
VLCYEKKENKHILLYSILSLHDLTGGVGDGSENYLIENYPEVEVAKVIFAKVSDFFQHGWSQTGVFLRS